MTPPFNLDGGLALERARILLPWGASVEQLACIGRPQVFRHPSTVNLVWSDEEIFESLAVNVAMHGAAGPNAFYVSCKAPAGSAQKQYEALLADLSERLGDPHSRLIDDGYPWTRWGWGEVTVSLRIAERFVESVVFMVSRRLVRP